MRTKNRRRADAGRRIGLVAGLGFCVTVALGEGCNVPPASGSSPTPPPSAAGSPEPSLAIPTKWPFGTAPVLSPVVPPPVQP